ncbi:MAG: DUF4252 domain-containing protein [Thermoanaerobaculia bacterium]|nr:DUF4252 domain-containing protein [Thermoanaerobaculia bacterium]
MRESAKGLSLSGLLAGLLAGLALLLGTVGCSSAPAVGEVASQLERQLPGAEFEREFHLRLGRLTLGMVRGLAGWAMPDEDEDLEMLRAVRRIDIGTYRVVSLPSLDDLTLPRRLVAALERSGWSLMVRTRQDGESIWLFVRQDGEGVIRSLYVVALDEVELTMVSLEGRLDRILAEAIADDPSGFAASFGS